MMNDPKFLQAPTILAGVHDAGFKVAASHRQGQAAHAARRYGLDYTSGRAIAFSSEKANQASEGR